MENPRLLFVHAHPDDETLTTGATIAHYVARGARVQVVTCTLGEEGEVIGERFAQLAVDAADQLGGYRIGELSSALAELPILVWVEPVQAPSNLTRICDRSIQPMIDGALDGSQKIDDVITSVKHRLWAMSTVLPIPQDSTIVAARPSVRNVSLTGAVPIEILGDAGNWAKAPQ